MNGNDLFDDITRILATRMPRRQAFGLIAKGVAGMVLASMGAKPAKAATCPPVPPGHLPRNPNIASRALCRGACGADCPATCTALDDVVLCATDKTSSVICRYTATQCGSHAGCRIHDACYDACATAVFPAICRRQCDVDCVNVFGTRNCGSWAKGGGPYDSQLRFSDPPTETVCGAGTRCCGDACCPAHRVCCEGKCCPRGSTCLPPAGGGAAACCPDRLVVGRVCCLGPDWHIKDGNCCPKSKAPKVSAFRAGTFVEIGIGFDGDGARIDAIHVLRADNATVEVAALQATADTSPVVSATKVDRSRPAVVELQVVDEYHRISTYAPVVTALQVPAGANQARETLTGLAPATCHLTVQNGAPGVTRLRIQLQGRRSQVVRLHDSELKTLRLPHGRAGKRALHLTALGRPGAAVLVIVGEQAQHQAVDWTGASPLSGQNLVWGSE